MKQLLTALGGGSGVERGSDALDGCESLRRGVESARDELGDEAVNDRLPLRVRGQECAEQVVQLCRDQFGSRVARCG